MPNLNRIKVVPVEQQKTGRWFASQIGKPACSASQRCSNTSQPDLTTPDRIAKAFNVDVKTLPNDTVFEQEQN